MFRKINVLVVVAVAIGSSAAVAADYSIDITPEVQGANIVTTSVRTNLPDGAVLAVQLGLTDLDPEDIAVGTSFERVPVSGGAAEVVIDVTTASTMPFGATLPAGNYEVEATFHPRWKENRDLAASIGVTEKIETIEVVYLEASGQDRREMIDFHDGQNWVMRNIGGGERWDIVQWIERFGDVEQLERTGSGNPAILKNYYVPVIDMTVKVNGPRGEIITWVTGKDTE